MSERQTLTAQEIQLRLFRRGLKELLDNNQTFRRFVWTIMSDAGIFHPTHRGSPYDTSYAEGRRALGLEVLHLLKSARLDILAVVESEGDLLAGKVTNLLKEAQSQEDEPE